MFQEGWLFISSQWHHCISVSTCRAWRDTAEDALCLGRWITLSLIENTQKGSLQEDNNHNACNFLLRVYFTIHTPKRLLVAHVVLLIVSEPTNVRQSDPSYRLSLHGDGDAVPHQQPILGRAGGGRDWVRRWRRAAVAGRAERAKWAHEDSSGVGLSDRGPSFIFLCRGVTDLYKRPRLRPQAEETPGETLTIPADHQGT